MAHHLRLDLDLIELLASIDADDRADCFNYDDYASKVHLDQVGLLVRFGVLLGLAQFLDQAPQAARLRPRLK